MEIQSLGYVDVEARDPLAMARFAEDVLGAEVVEGAGGVQFIRLDERHHRMAVRPGLRDGALLGMGLEVRDRAALAVAGRGLRAAGVCVTEGTPEQCVERHVNEFITFNDPVGHPVEVFYGYRHMAVPFRPARPGMGRRTLGHLVLGTPDVPVLERFYVDLLGFGVSDYADYSRNGKPAKAVFLHCADRRHHTLALGDFAPGLHHVLIEVETLDDVGSNYDRVRKDGVPVARTLGRHSNDHMVSFYVASPCGLKFEYGWGGRLVDDDWRICRSDVISLWGHELLIP